MTLKPNTVIRILFLIGLLISSRNLVAVELAPLASPEETRKALKVFEDWMKHYQERAFRKHYSYVHPRIRYYKSYKGWRKIMRKSVNKNGELIGYELVGFGPITADKIPCTEMGHCYRRDMQVVVIVVNSEYKKIGIKEKELVIMANSVEGWRFGGGTVLNRPFGETLGILDRQDERRYEYKGINIVQ